MHGRVIVVDLCVCVCVCVCVFLVLAIVQAISTCIQKYLFCYTWKYNVCYLWGRSSVLSLEQYGTLVYNHLYREHQPHVARMVLGGRLGRSGGEQISSHHHGCIEILSLSALTVVYPAPY